ncbi:hypothetical protein AcW1_006740 [Taiwanofungus camphoratus]|nr:hypothetical protein AcV5_009329 [Antrodia cinnamomea]KAI0924695.1 hypothetical protein AcW2_005504 [Antrodia cinnamomea]KAI0953942.1 hypothetical protein AcV7_007327 [Antrodia cinnamomea]KAI0955032.1 hypothetical protein AcW1_006740 [Antrodia cinnamomea]
MSHIFRNSFSDANMASLELANPYIGLDDLYKSGIVNASKIGPILNMPRVATQIYYDRQNEPAPSGEHDYLTEYGTMTPHKKHLRVDKKTHTIVQFRATDFGMEDCSLVLRLPRFDEELEGSSPFIMEADTQPGPLLEICRLISERSLDAREWRSCPACVKEMAPVVARAGEETLISGFPCPWGSLHTFEIACKGGSDCLVDVWSSKNQTWGESLP